MKLPPPEMSASMSRPVPQTDNNGAAKETRQRKRVAAIPAPKEKSEKEIENPDVGAVGMDESSIRQLFGVPNAEVDDAPAKRLSYRTGSCSVEFALYPDVDTRTYRTLSSEVKNDDGTAKGQRICVADIKSRIEDRRHKAE
jgi:hypothetical protein